MLLLAETNPKSENSNPSVEEILSRQQLDLDRLKDAFGLLCIRACCCQKFFRRSDPGTPFDAEANYKRSHKPSWPMVAVFVSGHRRSQVDTLKTPVRRLAVSLFLYHQGVTLATRLVRVLHLEGPI
jgi:hypothetical protein